ncbi:MAG: TetR/AcrR family transcriptional regulator [Desulfobacterales bacterium]|nr:TetR/AcrR family transcriptional regulator [Desulfobacterales bacterium]
MPPKQRFSYEDVVEAAFAVVRREGWQGLSARAIAKELNASTRPIYDHLKSMRHIEEEVVKKALTYFVEFISRDRTGDRWLDQALGYVLFADQERHLFRCINDEKHIQAQKKFARTHWDKLDEQLSADPRFKGRSKAERDRIRIARWFMIHGLSFLVSNGWILLPREEKSVLSEQVGMPLLDFLRTANQALYDGFIQSVEQEDPSEEP